MNMSEKFKNPPEEYRSAPFWSWNDKLCEEELIRQVQEMKDKGMGGFFMHSREGLETEYMSEEWLKCIKETVKAAKANGMGAWLYDEDKWPSGAAGGLVLIKGGDASRSKALTIEVSKDCCSIDDKVLAVFKAGIDGDNISACERVYTDQLLQCEDGQVLLVFRREVSGPSEWFNNDAPSDNLNPDSVKLFIETTYETYKREVGYEFGKAIPGIFTDEPNIAEHCGAYSGNRGWIPWTDGFIEYFKEKRGYDFIDFIPYIFFKGEKSAKTRHDYWRTITERFCEAYTKQLGEWCANNRLAFTGHFLFENELGLATRTTGAIMPHYRYQQIPGIDMLCEQAQEILTVKQCTSVANQYGRKRVLSEMYGCTGWDFSFEGQKWVGDWQFALGVNLRCQHLALYSLKGCRKRDYPPVFNYNTSWWKYNKLTEDYFARISAVMSDSNAVRDVLVIHPASTAWSMLGCGVENKGILQDTEAHIVNRYGDEFNEFLKYLLSVHYDFDLGDETIMKETGRVEGNQLHVNRAAYKLVIIPAVRTLLASTVELLSNFLDAGGRVITLKQLPELVEGEKNNALKLLFEHENNVLAGSSKEVRTILEKSLERRVSIRDRYDTEAAGLWYLYKELPDCKALFIANTDRKNDYDVNITVDCIGNIEEWDPLTGEIKEIPSAIIDGRIHFSVKFAPISSGLYMIHPKRQPKQPEENKTEGWSFMLHKNKTFHAMLGPMCRFSRTMPNALVLDKCVYRTDGGEWSEEKDVWQAQRDIRENLGMRQIYYNGLPQRYRWIDIQHPNDGTPVELKFTFNVDTVPINDIYLVLETAKLYSLKQNGTEIPNKPEGWFVDKAFDKIRLTAPKPGRNELVLSCGYMNRMELEDCYIIGDFAVDAGRKITAEPDMLHFGDWCLQGYFHYYGSIVYHFDFEFPGNIGEKAILELGDYRAITAEIRVNGITVGHIPWKAANGIDITDHLAKGINKIDIEVMGSPRNLFGPFHQADSERLWTDWASFRREGVEYTPEYLVKPYGLLGQVKICKE